MKSEVNFTRINSNAVKGKKNNKASYTVLPSMTCSSSKTLSMTAESANVTNPNPRGFLVCLSSIITESVISPYFSKCSLKPAEKNREKTEALI